MLFFDRDRDIALLQAGITLEFTKLVIAPDAKVGSEVVASGAPEGSSVVERHVYAVFQEHFRQFRFSPITTRHDGSFIGKNDLRSAVNHVISHCPQKMGALSDGFWAYRECVLSSANRRI